MTENPANQVWHTLQPPAATGMLLLLVATDRVERTQELVDAMAAVQPVKLEDHVMLTGDADHPRRSHNPDRGGPDSIVAPRGVLTGLDQQWRRKFRYVRVLAFSHVSHDSLPTFQPTSKGSGNGRTDSQIPGTTRPSESDLDAFIASLSPPTVEEIVKSLEPIPTLDQLLDDLKHPERLPPRPLLPEETAARVEELEKRIVGSHEAGHSGDDKATQDAAFAEAIELAERVLTIRLEQQGPDSPLGSKWTSDDGEPTEWYKIGDARQLVAHLRLAVRLSIKQRIEWRDADVNGSEATRLYFRGNYDRALELFREELRIRRRLLGDEHPAVATSLSSVAKLLRDKGEYAAAEPLLREALAMNRKLLGDEHPAVAVTLNNLALVLDDRGDYAAAEALYGEALAMYRKLLGNVHPEVANSLNNLAALLHHQGDYAAAEPLHRDALAMQRELLGDGHPKVATSLNNLGLLLHDKGDYAAAEPLFREALAKLLKLLGDEHSDVADSLSNLAVLLKDKGDYAAAEPLYRKALAMTRKLLGDQHPRVATSLDNLAVFLQDKGDYAAAEPLFREALTMHRKLLGDEHPDVAASLNNLAVSLVKRADYATAESLSREALAMFRELLGNEHPDVALSLNNLAALLHENGDYAASEPLYREALAMRRKLLGDEHPDVATSLNNLASLLTDYAASEPLYREALAMRRKLLGDEHPQVAAILSNLAWLQSDKGDYAAAEPLLLEAVAVLEKARLRFSARGGLERVGVARMTPLAHLAGVQARLGRPSDAWRHLEANFARGLLDEIALRQSRPLTENERDRENSLIGRLNKLDERTSALHGRPESTDRDELLAKLRRERETLQAALVQFAAAMQDKYGVAAGQVYELEQIQRGLAEDTALVAWLDIKGDPHAVNPNGEHWVCIVRNTGDPIWIELRGSGADGLWTKDDDTLPTHVGELLRMEATVTLPPSLAIPKLPEAFRERNIDIQGRSLIASNHRISPQTKDHLLALSDAESWRAVVETLSERSVRIGKVDLRKTLVSRLRAQRIDPAKWCLDGVRHLIVLPAGRLARVPIEALADEHVISYAPSATMYTWLKEKRDQGIGGSRDQGVGLLLALGDPVFKRPGTDEPTKSPTPPDHGALVMSVVAESNAARNGVEAGDVLLTYNVTKLSGAADLRPAIQQAAADFTGDNTTRGAAGVPVKIWRNGKTVDLTLAPGRMGVRTSQRPAAEAVELRRSLDRAVATRGGTYRKLHGTRREVNAIRGLFGSEGKHVVLLGSEASEQRLAELAESGRLKDFRYLHFATHGVLDDERAMRSALILSQDNLPDPYKRALADEEVFDGRLTAEQIVRTWKLDADLVTLSACQTALGKQAGGEGFLGFSQALFVVGARSLVLSLWKVDDLATMLLMQRFYENLLGRYDEARSTPGREFPAGTPLPKVEALREAKRAIQAMTWDQAKRRSGMTENEFKLYRADRSDFGKAIAPRGKLMPGSPFDHPNYWAAFILLGNPE